MKNICKVLVVLFALCSVPVNADQVNIGIDTPDINIGIDLFDYPQLVVVPGYPVYYAPQLDANYFFYDGEYWVYEDDNWYQSSWYNGPWWLVDPEDVPEFVLRIPVRYYVRPPTYFFIWRASEPPHWGEHWGGDWEQHRRGWDHWDRNVHVKPAPLPLYQRQYSADRYPAEIEQQRELQQKHYRYQPRDPRVQQQYREHAVQGGPVQQQIITRPPQTGGAAPQENRRSVPRQQGSGTVPGTPDVHQRGTTSRGSPREVEPGKQAPGQEQQPKHDAVRREQQIQRPHDGEARPQGNESRQQDRSEGRESGGGQGRDQERGRDR